ncbi:MAG: cell division protein FtsZ [Cyclobacteriaceae bacterium]|nr:cell division protein FtsZ [Cyclobacteriaceae bacterium]
MTDISYSFDIPKHHKSIIKVIGVGGGGSNAVNHMYNQGIRDVEFIICNTDAQALMTSPVPNRLQIGEHLTQGLGAGANPEKGMNAALESKEDIRDLLSDSTKMVFITAGMGGGTGTGAAPVIAKVARDLGILTVGIVTVPFGFEGGKKMVQAEAGVNELKANCDTVLVILNDKLREIYGNLSIRDAFAQADNILTTAAKGIAEIITVPGYVNVDFEDVKTVMSNSGSAVMGSAITKGENRARRAAEEALASPLLNEKEIHGAQKVLLSIISGEEAELQMDELAEITDYIMEMAGDEAEVIFGHGIDAELGECIRVTVIATGFDHQNEYLRVKKSTVIHLDSSKPMVKETPLQNADPGVSDPKPQRKPTNTQPGLFDGVDRSIRWENPSKPKEAEQEQLSTIKLGPDENILEEISKEQTKVFSSVTDTSSRNIDSKKEDLLQQSKIRIEKLNGAKSLSHDKEEDYREKWSTPAYLRRNVNLQDVPHSSEQNVSRYHLNDDNQLLGSNRFLHDNVD